MASGFFGTENKVSRTIRRQGVSANIQIPLPAYSAVRRFTVVNNAALAVTGGIRIGNVTTGTQFVTALAVGATVNAVLEQLPTISGMSQVATTLFVEAVTSWNGTNVDIVVEYDEISPLAKPSAAG